MTKGDKQLSKSKSSVKKGISAKSHKKLLFVKALKNKVKDIKRLNIVLAISVAAIILISFIVYTALCSSVSIAKFLPKANTVAFIEYEDSSKIEDYGVNMSEITTQIESYLHIHFDEVKEWIGKKKGVSFLTNENELQYVLFLETRNRNKTISFFQSLGIENEELETNDYNGYSVYYYPYSRNEVFTFINSYIVVAQTEDLIKNIIDVQYDKNLTLGGSPLFVRVKENLPKNHFLFGYLDLSMYKPLLEGELAQYAYFCDIFKQSGVALSYEKNGVKFHNFTAVDKSLLPDEKMLARRDKFENHLIKNLSSDGLIGYFGGVNLSSFMENQLSLMDTFNPAFTLIVESLINANIQKFFGDGLHFKEDILPLFQKEYGIAVYLMNDSFVYHITLDSINPNFEEETIQKMVEVYKKKLAYLSPKIEERLLPDGTVSKELVADDMNIIPFEESYKDKVIKGVYIENSMDGLFYVILNDQIHISTYLETIKNTIDVVALEKTSIEGSDKYKEAKKKVHLYGDEINYLDIASIVELNAFSNPYFQYNKLRAILWNTKMFHDGISTEGVVTFQ